MSAPLFLIDGPWPGKLAIAPAPPPDARLKAALQQWQRLHITCIVSLMVPGEREGWENEEALCENLGIRLISIPIEDHSVPKPEEMQSIAARLDGLYKRLQGGQRVLVHCFAGIGRSGMVTAALLMLAGISLDDAVVKVSSARGLCCPETEEQLEWLASFDRFRRLSYT